MIYFTSDFHFCHDVNFICRPRGFLNADEMNRVMLDRYNDMIKDDDEVYILGDCVLNNVELGIEFLKLLNGHKYLAIGNHDTDAKIDAYIKADIFDDIQMAYRIKYRKKTYYASHYPTICTNYDDNKIWCLHGHTHQSINFSQYPNCYHVGVDSHNCYPVSIEQIQTEIKEWRY